MVAKCMSLGLIQMVLLPEFVAHLKKAKKPALYSSAFYRYVEAAIQDKQENIFQTTQLVAIDVSTSVYVRLMTLLGLRKYWTLLNIGLNTPHDMYEEIVAST